MGYTHYYGFSDDSTREKVLEILVPEIEMIVEASDVLVEIEHADKDERGLANEFRIDGVGDDSHEQLGSHDRFVTTNRKPYDLTVCVILLRMKQLGAGHFKLSSDGRWDDEWISARELYSSLWPDIGRELLCPWTESVPIQSQTRPNITQGSRYPGEITRSTRDIEHGYDEMLRSFVAQAQEAISQCIGHHPDHDMCIPEVLDWREVSGVAFRLVDVFRNCVIESIQPEEYVALSYVWGRAKQTCLTKETHRHLIKTGAFRHDRLTPARTILDAMAICKMLNRRYLWVDCLCIMQDNPRDRTFQILRMRQIFACAALTIVSGSAQHANECLTTRGYAYKASEPAQDIFVGSIWPKRAWTYQESVLSHRQLIFSPSGIHFGCQHSLKHLSQICPDDDLHAAMLSKPTFLSLIQTPGCQLQAWQEAVTDFSERDISFQEDLVNAFQGIMKSFGTDMDGLPNRFHHGLPTSAFDQVFGWSTSWHCPRSRRQGYPSWSWLGWKQRVTWSSGDWVTCPEKRSSQMLWPQWSDAYWKLFSKAYATESKTELARKEFERGNRFGGHQWYTRKPCYYWGNDSRFEGNFLWGLPAAHMNYSQSGQLWFAGCVVRLSVTEVEETARCDLTNRNRRYTMCSTTMSRRRFGTIDLDPVWYVEQPRQMYFLLIDGVYTIKGELVGTKLMCLTKCSVLGEACMLECERAQIVKVAPITEQDWTEADGIRVEIKMN